jgi:hypothetical protein
MMQRARTSVADLRHGVLGWEPAVPSNLGARHLGTL